jgi:hypothetical protein
MESYARRLRVWLNQIIEEPDRLSYPAVLPVDFQAASAAAELFAKSLLLGIDHGLPAEEEFADPVPVDILPYEEAVTYMRGRLPMGKDAYYALDDRTRFRAFAVSRLADSDAVERVQDFLTRSIEDGSTLTDFRRMTNEELTDAAGLGKEDGAYWETVYRTNVQTAYCVGRALGYEAVPPIAIELIGVEDTRQTETRRALTVPPFRRPYGDPVWQTLWPPFHFNCRTIPRAIYDEEEIEAGGEEFYTLRTPAAPDNGWGTYPLDKDDWWDLTEAMSERAGKAGISGELKEARKALIERIESTPFRVGRSVGAMATRFYVKQALPLQNGMGWIKEGTEVSGVKVITEGLNIREVQRLVKEYPLPNKNLTRAEDWFKVRGTGVVTDGVAEGRAEIHWYQCKDIGKVEFKVKRWQNKRGT